ncbi:MAG: malto-oligosyltrehalose trehalohydrolase [Candidatus Rokubacteria bacterium]|nr:malto-oligosyltrehalose trehalohydrolase [Candidatus Rokubacteria bacterium]
MELAIEGRPPAPMVAGADGVWEVSVSEAAAGTRYQYRLDGERYRPDPVSRFQPQGVHGPSVVVDPDAFAWTDQGFRGAPLAEQAIYELHVGTFSTAGTFEGVIPYLPGLVDLGVTAIEIMPVAEFPGSRNWGYDGVHLYAPQSTYGGPRGLRRLVDACHARGLSVILDVVYNHLGPEGNYLAEFGPYFSERYKTPWGAAIDYDGPESGAVRRHVVENARAWIGEFHLDGLRLDAIHAIHDASGVHVLTEVAQAAREAGARLGKPAHVIAESHDNDRRIVLPARAGGLGLDAVWSDDFHHALHVTLTGERAGYYVDFGRAGQLPRTLAEGFAFQGEPSAYFGGARGTASADLEGDRFVIATQTHDQVGNRAQGGRLGTIAPFEAVKLAAALMLAAPAVPLLFMGEEYGETAPFPYFTSFLDRGLAEAVRRGRAGEFERFAWQGPIPDPGDPATFVRARLNHALASAPRHRELREFYRRWLALRREHPALGALGKPRARARLAEDGRVLTLERAGPSGERVVLVANLGAEPVTWSGPAGARVLIDSADRAFGGAAVTRPLAAWQVLLFEPRR